MVLKGVECDLQLLNGKVVELAHLEILYENGIIAAILIFGGIVLLFISAIKASIQAGEEKGRILLQCMIVILVSWLIHTGLTFPILAILNSPSYRH